MSYLDTVITYALSQHPGQPRTVAQILGECKTEVTSASVIIRLDLIRQGRYEIPGVRVLDGQPMKAVYETCG